MLSRNENPEPATDEQREQGREKQRAKTAANGGDPFAGIPAYDDEEF